MNAAINKIQPSPSDALEAILNSAAMKHGSFNDFVFLETPQQSKDQKDTPYYWTAQTIRVEGEEVVKGYAIWDLSVLKATSRTVNLADKAWQNIDPHIIGMKWFNKKSDNDMTVLISELSQTR